MFFKGYLEGQNDLSVYDNKYVNDNKRFILLVNIKYHEKIMDIINSFEIYYDNLIFDALRASTVIFEKVCEKYKFPKNTLETFIKKYRITENHDDSNFHAYHSGHVVKFIKPFNELCRLINDQGYQIVNVESIIFEALFFKKNYKIHEIFKYREKLRKDEVININNLTKKTHRYQTKIPSSSVAVQLKNYINFTNNEFLKIVYPVSSHKEEDFFSKLPNEILITILKELKDITDIFAVMRTSKKLMELSNDKEVWLNIIKINNIPWRAIDFLSSYSGTRSSMGNIEEEIDAVSEFVLKNENLKCDKSDCRNLYRNPNYEKLIDPKGLAKNNSLLNDYRSREYDKIYPRYDEESMNNEYKTLLFDSMCHNSCTLCGCCF